MIDKLQTGMILNDKFSFVKDDSIKNFYTKNRYTL